MVKSWGRCSRVLQSTTCLIMLSESVLLLLRLLVCLICLLKMVMRAWRRRMYRLRYRKRWQQRRNSRLGRRKRSYKTFKSSKRNLAKLNQVKVTVRDLDYHIIKIPYTGGDPRQIGSENAEMFKTDVPVHALKMKLFTLNLQRYKWIKFNYFSFYITADCISYDIYPYKDEQSKTSGLLSPGINEFFKHLPFYLQWDLDVTFDNRDLTEVNYPNDVHAKKIFIGSRKPAVFKYVIPQHLRKYLPCGVVKSQVTTKPLPLYLQELFKSDNFRVPSVFYGGVTNLMRALDLFYNKPSEGRDVPLRFVLTVKCYANVTFKGIDLV
ncbi:hypothetical protein [Dragonfly circularisvirus]|uniref:Capsid protein n=1 Tax=Dragonfly circularisvirus TaxID=1234872 RepID=K0A2I2_9VIRU|nr:hypothetical protein [Dragonfly circularisvirus]AFS65298.1 hypothetical protein [Dragonfly circularisvirus]